MAVMVMVMVMGIAATPAAFVTTIRVRVRDRVRVRGIFSSVRHRGVERSGNRTLVDGVCDFEKVLPDQLCPSAKRD